MPDNNPRTRVECCANCNNLEKDYDTDGGYCKLLITNTGNYGIDHNVALVDCDEICDKYE